MTKTTKINKGQKAQNKLKGHSKWNLKMESDKGMSPKLKYYQN